jgi:hypothetical protein
LTVHLEPSQLAKRRLVKMARAAVRLKHALAADEELNEILPELEKAFDAQVQARVLPDAIDIDAIVRKAVS